MNEQQLFDFYASGGDLAQLSDQDVVTLGRMLKVTGSTIEPPPSFGPPATPGAPASTTGPSNIGDIDPREFVKWLVSTIPQALSIGAGMVGPAGIPVRMGIQGLLGALTGAIDPEEEQGRLESAVNMGAFQAGLEGVGSVASKVLPWLGTQAAVRMGVPPGVRSGGRTRKFVESFLNERRRGGITGWGQTPAVGQKTTALRKATGQPSLKRDLSEQMDVLKGQLPERIKPFGEVEEAATTGNQLRKPESFLGLDDPRQAAKTIAESDEKFWAGNEELLGHMQGTAGSTARATRRATTRPYFPGPDERLLPPPPNTLPGGVRGKETRGLSIESPGEPRVNFGDLVEMAQKQGASAAPTFEKTAAGKWVRASDTPEKIAARERNRLLKDEAVNLARGQEGGGEVADTYLNLNKRLTDAFKIEQAADKLRRGLAFTGIRGGLGSGLGLTAGTLLGGLGGASIGGPIGGGIGLLATPGNISRAGSLGGRLGEVTPSAWRIYQLIQQLEEGPKEKTPVRLREAK